MTALPPNVSLNKDSKSPYWFATWRTASGRQVRRSTKVPHAGGFYAGEHLTKAQAEKRAMRVGFQLATQEQAHQNNTTVRELFDTMLSGKLGLVSAATYYNARTDYNQFCAWLGKRANEPARLITKADIKSWIMARRAEVRHKTVKKALCAISSAFKWAVDSEIMLANPCLGCKIPPDTKTEKTVKEAFTIEEIRLLIDKLPAEWSSAVRCCIGTYGQRLGDILSLRWEQFDFSARTVTIVTGKTARHLTQPMSEDFYQWAVKRHAEAMQEGGESAVWVHPKLHQHSNPSQEFTQLVRLHGIGLTGTAAGGNRRNWHSKTFHSLRASVVTMLHAAGVNPVAAKYLVGHDSQDVHEIYYRPSDEQLAATAANMPKL